MVLDCYMYQRFNLQGNFYFTLQVLEIFLV